MSRLEELIQKLCPDGVEYKPLWSVTIWDKRFNSVDRTKQPRVEEYRYLLASNLFSIEVKGGDVFLLSTGEQTGWTTEKAAGIFLKQGEVVTIPWGKSRDVTDCIKYYKGKFVTADNRIATSNDTTKLSNKYLYYWMMNNGKTIDKFYRGSGIKHPDMSKILDMLIPIPPMNVQKEIVRILDKFTELTEELTEELTAELTARKKQYEYYRDTLLTFDADNTNNLVWSKLKEIADIGTGNSNTDEAVENGAYPFYVRSSEPLRKNSYEYDETAIITAGNGVGVGKVYHYVEGKYSLHQRAYRIHVNVSDIMPRYLFHYMKSKFLPYIQKAMYQGSVPSIRRPMFNEFPVPIPHLCVQKRLVTVLDNFETICSDLNIGLPAEIEARQKQYEFYRDGLLTFMENGGRILSQPADCNGLIRLCQYVYGVIFVELGDITYYPNDRIQRDQITKENYTSVENLLQNKAGRKDADKVPSGGNFIKYVDNDILIGNIRPYLKKIWKADKTGGTNGDVLVVRCLDNTLVKPSYLYYVLASDDFFNFDCNLSKGAKMPRGDKQKIMKYRFCLPSLKTQEKIVDILDRFDVLCNDISEGLPAEIEARQKQYEYYRDKLLTFPAIEK